MKVQIRACELVDVEELLSNIQELLSRVVSTLLLTTTLLLSSLSFTVFAFVIILMFSFALLSMLELGHQVIFLVEDQQDDYYYYY